MEERVDKEVERRMADNFLDWEDRIKAKKLQQFKDIITKDVQQEYEVKFKQALEEENQKIQEQYQQAIQENIRIAREEAQLMIDE